jgi:hypothetical protein
MHREVRVSYALALLLAIAATTACVSKSPSTISTAVDGGGVAAAASGFGTERAAQRVEPAP